LYYQSTSKEFVEFLRDENTTNTKGQELYDLWNNNGKCPPESMAQAQVSLLNCSDGDEDGYDAYHAVDCPTGNDCDDSDPDIHPDAEETCDGVDNNCGGGIDEEPLASNSCDNGDFCDGTEYCDAGSCRTGTAPDCDDGVGCTLDSCNETTDSCENIPNDAVCDDGLYCNGAETCDAVLDCRPGGGDPCTPPLVCDEGIDACVGCVTNPECDDGLYCNGIETCVTGTCQSGAPVDCDDGNTCTDDSCNEGADSCENTCNATGPSDGCCDNPACTGDPICVDACVDNDGDGYGDPANPACTYPEVDCDDSNPFVYPGALELCDGIDNQCPGDTGYGIPDEGCSSSCTGTAAASTMGASPVYGPNDLGRHVTYFLFPMGAVVLLAIRRRSRKSSAG
jgi:hypothetical protein